MAKSKTLAPTGETVQIPAMTDAPDMAVPANAIDKTIDAVNALDSKTGNIDWAKKGTNIHNNLDINSYKTPGKYFSSSTSATSTMSNAPVTGGFSLFVIILGYDWVNQYAMPVNGQTIKHRSYNPSNDTWSAWQTLTFA